jgi:K(+)-stimulated pyrophosphate-energized sodium pump
MVNAATRASESFLWRETKYTALAVATFIALLVGTHALFLVRKVIGQSFDAVLWTAFAMLLGAAATSCVAYVTTQMGLRASLRTLRAAHLNVAQATAVAVRGAGSAALVAEGLGAAAVASLLGLSYLLGGGGAITSPDRAAELLERATTVLPGLCLGSVTAASVFGLGGANYHVSAEVGGLSAAGLEKTDSRNPSIVADLVGDHVGLGARCAVDMFAAVTLANVTAVLLGVAAFRVDGGASGAHAWSLVTLPLVVRGVGVIASLLGLVAARSGEHERAANALWRGQATTAAVVLGGLCGASFWLVGGAGFQWLVLAGAVGILAGLSIAQLARLGVNRREKAVQEVLEATRSGAAVAIARSLAHGQAGVFAPIAILGASLTAAFHLGARTSLGEGGLLGVATALACVVAMSPYMLAVALFGPIVGGATTVTALDPDDGAADTRRRSALLDDAAFEGGTGARSFFIVLGSAASLVAGLSIPLASGSRAESRASILDPAIVLSGLLGATVVATLCGHALLAASRAGRAVAQEVDRQLRGFPREGGVAVIPEGYTPSYRAVVELASKLSLRGVILPTLAGVAAPAALCFALRLLYTSSGLAAEGLTSFVVLAAVTGLGTALANDGSRGVLRAAQRVNRARGAGSEATLEGHALSSFFGEITGPAAHLFVKTAAATALVIAPLLSSS